MISNFGRSANNVWAALCACATAALAAPSAPPSPIPSPLPPSASAPAAQQVVARLELAAPALSEFLCRGTIPLPPGTWVEGSALPAFYLRDGSGALVRAQVEIVSRYPRAQDGADVVELLAHVRRGSAAPGTQIQLDVLRGDPTPLTEAFAFTPEVAALLAQPGGILLRAADVADNTYRYALDLPAILSGNPSDTLGFEIRRSGHVVQQARLSGAMRPAALGPFPGSALPHFPGIHAYLTAFAGERVLALDLRVHNGLAGKDKTSPLDDALQKIHFKGLELVLAPGWSALSDVGDPTLGPAHVAPNGATIVPLVKANADGSFHYMPRQAQFHRRLVLVPPPTPGKPDLAQAEHHLSEAGLGFARAGTNPLGQPLYSWWNLTTARYFPQRHVLASLEHLGADAIRAAHQADLSWLSNLVQTGASASGGLYPVPSASLGWAHPWGVAYGGMASGLEIVFWEGSDVAWAASGAGYRYLRLVRGMQSERQRNVLYDLDGTPTALEDWVIDGPSFDYVPMNFYMGLSGQEDPFGFDEAPTFQAALVESLGLAPAYQAALASYEPYDLHHLVRYTRSAKVLAWLGNDAVAEDDLRMQAELVRLSYNPYHNSSGGYVQPTGLLFDQQDVAANPGTGVDFGRGEGWGLDAVVASYALAPPSWRASVRPWLDAVADLVLAGQSNCSGIIQSTISQKLLDGKYAARQSIEESIVQNALRGAIESVYRGDDPARTAALEAALRDSCYGLVAGPSWSSTQHGPWSQLAVGAPLPGMPFCGTLPGDGYTDFVDDYQSWAAFAYGFELSGDPLFLARAMEMAGGPLKPALQATPLDNIGNQIALLALLQQLGF